MATRRVSSQALALDSSGSVQFLQLFLCLQDVVHATSGWNARPLANLLSTTQLLCLPNRRATLQDSVDKVGQRMAEARQALGSQVADRLLAGGGTVMTLSYSSSVINGFRVASQQHHANSAQQGGAISPLTAIVCESRPLLEGLKTAKQLIEAGVSTTVITDAQAALFVPQANVVIIGADCITQEGAVNKVRPDYTLGMSQISPTHFSTCVKQHMV